MSSSTSNTQNRLRRSLSTRSMKKPRSTLSNLTPEVSMQHAAAAASKAMESSQRYSQESGPSLNRLGGPSSIGVSRSRPGSRLRYSENNASIHHHNSSSGFSTPPVPQLTTRVSIDSSRIGDIAAFPPITELDGLDGRNSSVPSSFRRLRKAKSMHTTKPRTSQTPYGVPPIPSGDPSDPDRSPGFQLPRTMRPSMSFIRGKHKSQSALNTNTNGAAVKLARNQFTQEPGEPGIRHRRSSFLLRQKKERRPFRKSFRAASEDKSPATGSANSRARSAPRSLSSSIKNRLKRVFRFSKATGQQPTVEETGHCDTPHSYRDTEQSPGRDSVCTSKSRVTSWADSTVANTARSPRKPGHRPSLSMVREDVGGEQQMPITPVKTDDEEAPSILTPSPRHIGPVDSEQLYFALLEQIGIPRPDRSEMIFGSVSHRRVLPVHVSSAGSPRSRGQTLRYVPSNESSSPGSFLTAQNLSTFVADEHSDDAKSVIVAPYMPERDVVSPSIYSRSTDEDTPPKADTADTLDVGMYDELGTATIYAPERTSYVSPEPIDRSFSRRRADPSADWQLFLNSEVDKLEQASPAKKHVRENAQLHGDDEDVVTMTAEAALVMHTPPRPISREDGTGEWTVYDTAVQDKKVPSYSNFSRPFRQVPAIQPILPLHPKKSEHSMQKLSVDPVKDNAGQMAENISPTPLPFVQSQRLSPIRLRSGNMQLPESPTPKPMGSKRSLTKEQLRRHSSKVAPLSHEGRNRTGQFRSMGTQRDFPSNDENQRLGEGWDEVMERWYPQGSYPTMSSDQQGESHRTMPSNQHPGPVLTKPAERMLGLFLNRPRPQRQPMTDKDSTEAFL